MAPGPSPTFHRLTVRDVEPLTDDSAAVTFDVPDDLRELFAFEPGESLTLRRVVDGVEHRLRELGPVVPLLDRLEAPIVQGVDRQGDGHEAAEGDGQLGNDLEIVKRAHRPARKGSSRGSRG